ncbi:MAG: hypothetical protein LBD99_00405 [Candidatus Margulisbacteria bacterium]|jgi:ferrous iron transport protein B|nr:hypothetical protein [Candidatus Margulisiibacteriota bacterium]
MTKTLLLIGQNFSGKTELFHNLAENGRIKTIYYPQTGIPYEESFTRIGGERCRLINTPGIYTLIPTSEYEIITLDLILSRQPDKIIFVMQENTLKSSVLIMIQLAELGIPFIVNYVRSVSGAAYVFDRAKLAHTFNAEVVFSSPVFEPSARELKKALERGSKPRWVGNYSRAVEKTLQTFVREFQFQIRSKISLRFLSLMLLLGNKNIAGWLRRNYPPALSRKMLKYMDSRYELANAFAIANRWESLGGNLCRAVWRPEQPRGLRLSYVLEKYSLKFIWDAVIAALSLIFMFGFVNLCGSKMLVNFFYRELLGKYFIPFCTYFLTGWFGDGFLAAFFVGPYGLLTTGLAYALAVMLPLLASFFFAYALLENSGYIDRLSLTFNRLLKLFGLNGYAAPALLFGCCKIAALHKTRTLYTRRERALSLLLLIFFLPCVSQLVIVFNLLTIIPRHYALIFLGVLLGQLFILLNLRRLLPGGTGSHYLSELRPLHLPDPGKVFSAVWAYTRWYLRAICPLIIGISLLLFLSDAVGLLGLLKNLFAPFTVVFLDLPEAFTDSLILGLFRKDLSAVSLYDLANNGMLNSIQVLVACLFISLSAPCLGFVSELGRQRGWRQALLIFALSTAYAFTIAALVNKILRI